MRRPLHREKCFGPLPVVPFKMQVLGNGKLEERDGGGGYNVGFKTILFSARHGGYVGFGGMHAALSEV